MVRTMAVSFLMAVLLLLTPALRAGEAAPPKADEADWQAKVKALEKRVQQLEDELARERAGRGTAPGDWLQRRGFNRDLDGFMDRLRREMERDFGQDLGWWPGPRRAAPGSKPRLGVELAAPSDELRERYKNDVKEGAFVMSVVPASPAEKAGLSVGDAITSFNGKEVRAPSDLIDAVKAAPRGKIEMLVTRRGESIKLKVELGEPVAEAEDNGDPGILPRGGWLQRGDGPGKAKTTSRAEVKASTLELTDGLAKELKLTAEQTKKMSDVLAKHSQALTEEAAPKGEKGARRGAFTFSLTGDVSKLVEKHVAEAEKELGGTLSAEQLKQWSDYRKAHSSISVSHSMKTESGGGLEADPGEETMGF